MNNLFGNLVLKQGFLFWCEYPGANGDNYFEIGSSRCFSIQKYRSIIKSGNKKI
jgi:hypothetical protein